MKSDDYEAGYDMHGGSTAGFVAGSILTSATAGSRYQAVIADGGGYNEVRV